MPATKKKKKLVKTTSVVEKKVEVMSEQMNMLLFVFALAMMMFAYVLYVTFTR